MSQSRERRRSERSTKLLNIILHHVALDEMDDFVITEEEVLAKAKGQMGPTAARESLKFLVEFGQMVEISDGYVFGAGLHQIKNQLAEGSHYAAGISSAPVTEFRFVVFEVFDGDGRLEKFAADALPDGFPFQAKKTYQDQDEWYWAKAGRLIGGAVPPDQWEQSVGCRMVKGKKDEKHLGFVHGTDCLLSIKVGVMYSSRHGKNSDERITLPLCQKQFEGTWWDVVNI